MNYPKPKYGTILRGSEKCVDKGLVYNYHGYTISEAEAVYRIDPPFNGLSICTRPCWIVSQNFRNLMVVDGDSDEAKRMVDKEYPNKQRKQPKKQQVVDEYEEESSSSSSESSEDEVERINLQYETTLHIPTTKRRIGRQRRKQ